MQDNVPFQSWGNSFLVVMVVLGSQRLNHWLSRRGQGWDRRLGRAREVRENVEEFKGSLKEPVNSTDYTNIFLESLFIFSFTVAEYS